MTVLNRRCARSGLLVLLLLAGGCTSVNGRLNPPEVPQEARQRNVTRAALAPAAEPLGQADDGYFVGIGISGGGSRSANFSAACIFQLQRLGLMKRADYISSVSGGSLTAAYYCLSTDQEWNPGNVQRKLSHSFATDLLVATLLPWNLVAMLVSDFDRSDLLAAKFRDVLYARDRRELTFGDLRADRPRLLINATDLQSGKAFVFCNETFDHLNSDLAGYPIAHAVAASSAVPVLLHQVTLRDHNTIFKQYRHLVDGGVVDNLGVKTLVETYRAQVQANPSAYPRGAVFIVLDARTQYDARVSNRGDTSLLESLQFGTGLTSTVLLNRASSATLAEIILDSAPDHVDAATLRKEREDLINGGYVRLENVEGRPVYVLHLALSRVDDIADLPFTSFTQSVNSIATYFNISGGEASQLYQAAELLVERRFRQALAEITDELNGATTRPVAKP